MPFKNNVSAIGVALLFASTGLTGEPYETPAVADDGLLVTLFAKAPDIVHPVGLAFDGRGRLLAIESHTHFPPAGYKGLKHDRIRLIEDTDGDGKADRFTTFFEGTKHTMDIAVHFDGSVYLATRNEILRLRDTDGDGKADSKQRIVFLDTKGNYPHNGLSGLCFDSAGDLYFGMGENLGAAYKLVGSEGASPSPPAPLPRGARGVIAGQGDGGHVFHCTRDGKKLRKVATGFWNPFGVCEDLYGRHFAVDNDPDAMPPCRLLQVVEGADFGYQFRYGRSGRHPFQAWNGELPGTLPMVAGTGEAPCEVLAYESDGLPQSYRGNLLVTSWADHRVERYVLKPRGASFEATRKPFVQGGKNFRPNGLAVASDGSLFVGDWVLRDYNLHGKGAIWHIRAKQADVRKTAGDSLFSVDRDSRERIARKLAASEQGRAKLLKALASESPKVRATCLTALLDADDKKLDLLPYLRTEKHVGLRALAVRGLARRDAPAAAKFIGDPEPEVRLAAIDALMGAKHLPALLKLLTDADPFLRNAAVHQLARQPKLLASVDVSRASPTQRVGLLLAHRAADSTKLLPRFLSDSDEDVRFLAARWVADDKLEDYRPQVAGALKEKSLNIRLYQAFATALARLDGEEVNERKMADYFFDRLGDPKTPASIRAKALMLMPASHARVRLPLLKQTLADKNPALQLEAVRLLNEHADPKRFDMLADLAKSESTPEAVRAQAIVGLAANAGDYQDLLLTLARNPSPVLRDEALRSLVGLSPSAVQLGKALEVSDRDLQARLLGKAYYEKRPDLKNTDAWLELLKGPADASAGQRIFFHPKLSGCYRCHRVDGRGSVVGPDLSTIGRVGKKQILESILQPSNNVAPSYQAWHIATEDGKARIGVLFRTYLDEYTYLDANGQPFKVNTGDIVSSLPMPSSIMPDALISQLTNQEVRDLMAYLVSRK